MILKNKFAIGCLVQWYEVEIFDEYFQSLIRTLDKIENKENVVIDICFNTSQYLEKIDESQMTMKDVFKRFLEYRTQLINVFHIPNFHINYYEDDSKPYTIADYRRDFNEKYCEQVDVLMWGETDALIPRRTFEILDLLHTNNINQNVRKYIAFFGTCKMWDEGWKVLEHPDFTDKPHTDGDFDNWWSLCYTMNQKEMEEINNKVDELDVRVVNPYKFNGCGLVISSDIVKAGVNIPKSAFFIHEDTAFMHSLIKIFNGSIPQFVIKNILLVHNRKHPKKRQYVKDEVGNTPSQQRESTDWYQKAWKYSHHNVYKMYEQEKIYNWGDIFKDE
tara:strand:+ start:2870 stop:3865 length:996 start_codon:yes stop_codon:yes gene_type:complete